MRILLLGKNGQVGWELQRSLAPLGELLALDRHSTDWCGDLSQPDQLAQTIDRFAPQVIVNAAAHTAVDRAQSEPDLCHTINTRAPQAMAESARRHNALLVHYSTDYVFNGSGTTAWSEDDETGPLNVYGQTKLQGEQAIAASGCSHLIFRTSWVYAARGGNFAKTMLRLAKEKDALSVINDQHGVPTGAELIADVTAHAIRAVLADQQLGGLYHLSAAGETTWHGYASHVIATAAAAGVPLKVGADSIQAVPTSAFPTPAQRPLNSRLNTHKLQSHFGLRLPDWQLGVNRMLAEHLGDSK